MAIKFSQIFKRLNEIGEKMRHQFCEMQFIFENKCIKYNKPDTTNSFVILHILAKNPDQLYIFYKKNQYDNNPKMVPQNQCMELSLTSTDLLTK